MSTGFLSHDELSDNPIETARRSRLARGKPLLDLTDSNPTHNGLLFPVEILERAASRYWQERRYDPHPKGLLSARRAIRDYYLRRNPQLALSEEHIFITAGTSEAYSLLISLLTSPGESVLAPSPSYPLFDLLAAHARIQLLPYSLSKNPSCIEISTLDTLTGKVRAILLVSPHNPTGRVANKRSEQAAALGLPIICDEVFADFPYAIQSVPPLGTFYPDLPVFHLNGISKMFALPDLKLAWIALNDRALEMYGERLEFLNDTFLSCSSLIQHILPDIFAGAAVFQEQLRRTIRVNIDYVLAALSPLANVEIAAPDGGSFVFPKITNAADEQDMVLRLIEQGVLVHPGYFYGCENDAHILISCIVKDKLLQEGVDSIAKYLSQL